ncbi:hypothetical protein Ddye_011712 [Dipteronia dyeriana]|uniref:Pentatricopeptide repeat-containing protein n=1 Tax=Dipteronia dyeriana TaxID=168575 RepID=A0AAD9X306_9ROSI|nr:hypothetical protein Ddye_011712 [Dipteronia dyeriana]
MLHKSAMKLPCFLLLRSITARHICRRQSSSSSSSSSSSPPSTTSQSAFVNEVVAILNTISPIESALEPLVPFLSPDIIPSIIKETQNPKLGFRFYIWATNRKRLLSSVSRNLVVNMLLEPNGFDLFWTTLEELKETGVPVTTSAFDVLLYGYAKAGACEKVLESFGKMKDFDCVPGVSVYNTILHVVLRKQVFLLALALYNQMLKLNCGPTRHTFHVLIGGLCKSGKIQDALKMFDEMMLRGILPNRFTYTIVISGLCLAKRADDAHRLFIKMKNSGCSPDFVAYNALLNGFCKLGRVDEAFALLSSFEKEGDFKLQLRGYSSLIDGLFRANRYDEAYAWYRKMFEVNIEPDVVLYTVMIRGLSDAGKVKDAVKLMDEMNERGMDWLWRQNKYLMTWKRLDVFLLLLRSILLLMGFARQGANRVLDSASLQTMLEQYCESGLVLKAYKILMQLADSGNVPDLITYNTLINGFCRAGNINGALKLFKELQVKGLSPDSVTYGTLITGLLRIGREEDAFKIFDQMAENGCTPSQSVFKTLMTWSCRRSKVTLAFTLWLKYLRDISGREEEAIKVIEEHLEKGDFEKAVRGLLEMDFKLNDFNLGPYTIWLIGLCQAGLVGEGLKIFSILNECKVIVTPPSCVKLIHALCKRGKLNEAMDIFLYTLKNGFKLMPRVCNYLLRSILLSKDVKHHAYDLLSRMESLGYDLDSHLYGSTKALLSDPWNRMAMENASPG